MASDIYSKLLNVQMALKAPKGQYNKFGKYNYRSCEDILEAVKPLLKKEGLCLSIRDELEETASGRAFVKAVITMKDISGDGVFTAQAYAQLDNDKKGMDAPQQTGTASSYARKYALNGLFLIDDTKDSDTDEHRTEVQERQVAEKKQAAKKEDKPLTDQEIADLLAYLNGEGIDVEFVLSVYKITELGQLPRKQFELLTDKKNLETIKANYEKWAK